MQRQLVLRMTDGAGTLMDAPGLDVSFSDNRTVAYVRSEALTIPEKHAAHRRGVLLDVVPLFHQNTFLAQPIQGGAADAEVTQDGLGVDPQRRA